MAVRVYVSLTSGNVTMRSQQDYIKRVFDSKSVPYEEVDVAAPQHATDKTFMQEQVGKVKLQPQTDDQQLQTPILPPQIFHNDSYRGDFDGFFEAVETETMYKYLGLAAPPHEVEYQRQHQSADENNEL